MRERQARVWCAPCQKTYKRVFVPPGDLTHAFTDFRRDRRVAAAGADRANFGPCPVCGTPLERRENPFEAGKRELAQRQLQALPR